VLGAGGKMGPSLARRVRSACAAAAGGSASWPHRASPIRPCPRPSPRTGSRPLACDLLDPEQVARLPRVANVLYLAGRKFGSTDRPDLTWAHNTIVPMHVARHFAGARIVVFSSGNVYPLSPRTSSGATEADATGPVGEYAQSCLGRERVFEYFARENGTPCLLFRLFYAVDLRYGTLVDIARHVFAGEPVDLQVSRVNAIWQGDANSYALRALALCASPARPLVVTGPTPVSVREVAERFAARYGRPARFKGEEGPLALLGNPAECLSRLGPPEVPLERLIEWTAAWVEQGGRSLGKPTKFERTDGRF
jgi:nucleoside-diphosphate-sugar epimerase